MGFSEQILVGSKCAIDDGNQLCQLFTSFSALLISSRVYSVLTFTVLLFLSRECINQVCEAAGVKSVDRKRKVGAR